MNKEEKNIYIEVIDRKNKEIDEYRTQAKYYKERFRRLMTGVDGKPKFTMSPFSNSEDIDVWYPFDYDVTKEDIFKVIKVTKRNLNGGDILTTFTLRRVRKHE